MSAFDGDGVAATFNLERVSALLVQHEFKRIVLQFPDEHAAECVGVYDWLVTDVESRVSKDRADEIEVYIAADSTYGSSVDDISAEHVDGDVLVYFGSDLSSSGAMPVMVVPRAIPVDMDACATAISLQLSQWRSDGDNEGRMLRVVVTYEPGCAAGVPAVVQMLRERHGEWAEFTCARLPGCADLERWAPDNGTGSTGADMAHLGGLEVLPETLSTSTSSSSSSSSDAESSMAIVYIGDKVEQLDSVALQTGQVSILHYSNASKVCRAMRGEDSRSFRERFGGVARVEQSKVVGIIVGSMGLTGESTRGIVARLQTLCEAAGRKTYVFIMGRLNEAKLCNFPEIQVFCLVSNEDTSVIAPKTFPVPVITPWELELGLGAREWGSSYVSRPTAIFSGAGEGQEEEELERAIERVRKARIDNAYLSDEDEDGDDSGGGGGEGRLGEDEQYQEEEGDIGEISSRPGRGEQQQAQAQSDSQLVRVEKKEGRLVEFKSAAADFFADRKWQGLSALVSEEEEASLEILEGQSGIASGYGDRKPAEKD